ncbi:LexA family transcriptional regulator [Candidatus Hepatincola sp. Av]
MEDANNKSPLRKIREKKKLSLRKLAELTGLTNSYLSQLERGAKRLHSENLPILSKALDVSMGYLLGENELKDEYIYLLWYENIHFFANDNQKEELRPWGIFKEFLRNTFPGKDLENIVLIRMKDNSMFPDIRAEDIAICYKFDDNTTYDSLQGIYIFKYDGEVFVRRLVFHKEKSIISALATNKNYSSFDIHVSNKKKQLQVVGEVLSVVNQISTLK